MARLWSHIRRPPAQPARPSDTDAVTLRYAVPGELAALERLAVLDSSTLPAGPLLVAEVGGEPWAALSLLDGKTVADPFRPTLELVVLLRDRATQLRRTRPPAGLLTLEPLLSRARP